jgi:heptosyltransferase-2
MTQGKTNRALLVKLGAIGDVLMTIPAAYALHQQGVEIDWVCGQGVAPLLSCYPWIRTIVADDRALLLGTRTVQVKALASLWRVLVGRQYGICATLYYDARYRWITLPVRAARKVSLSVTDRAETLLPGRHHTDEYARIVLGLEDGERPVGLSPVCPVGLPVSPLARVMGKTRVVLAPAGAKNMMRDDALRRWPADRYVELARALLARGLDVVLVGGPEDRWVVPFFEGVGVTDLIAKLSLVDTVALLDESDVLVTHDTGPLHMGGITKTGIVAVFGPTDPRGRIPQRENVVGIWGGEGFACRPCYDGRDFAPCLSNGCMQQVTVAMVLEQVEAVLEQRRSGAKPPRVVTPQSTVVVEGWR